jgi:hypothetical protein
VLTAYPPEGGITAGQASSGTHLPLDLGEVLLMQTLFSV